jgi:hypothetical protein
MISYIGLFLVWFFFEVSKSCQGLKEQISENNSQMISMISSKNNIPFLKSAPFP